MPGKNQSYGQDYKTLAIVVTPEEHRDIKIKAATFGVTVSDVCRAALADDAAWRKAAKAKGKAAE